MFGGVVAASDVLCQIQADQLGRPVLRPEIIETTGLGAGGLAGLGVVVCSSLDELRASRRIDRTVAPSPRDHAGHRQWHVAVERAKGWATEG